MNEMEKLLRSIPEVNNLLTNGMSYEQIFRELCKQRGVNPDEFIKQFKDRFK